MRRSVRYYCMAEVLCALAILSVVVVSFYSIMASMSKAEDNLLLRRKAILAMDNAVETFAATLAPITPENVEKTLALEWKRQGLEENKKLRLERRYAPEPAAVVLDSKNHVIISVPLPLGGK